MRKVTKRLLTVAVAVFALGACQDSVTIVQPDPPAPPPPPPPPPPPVTVDATVSINGLALIPGPGSANPTAIAGDINVSLNIDEGTETITQVDLLFDGTPIGCQAIQTNVVPGERGETVSFSATGGADLVECFWNTDDVVGACVGAQLPSAFTNGTHTVGAQITLDDATTRTAENAQTVTLVNGSFISVNHLAGGQGVIGANGRLYWGGPSDLDGDGTDDNSLQFSACPVSYNGTTVGSVTVRGLTTDGSGFNVDLDGAGPGVGSTDAATPFVYTADESNNGTVEDDAVTGTGHTVSVTGSVFDDAGLNVTAEFAAGLMSLTSFWIDFQAPLVAAGAELLVGGASTAGGEYYSAGNALTLTGITEAGVGFTFGSGAGSQIDTGDCAVTANFDNNPATSFVPLFSDVSNADDAPEDDPVADADGNVNDCYVAEVVKLQDHLLNMTNLIGLGTPTGAINTGATGTAAAWGVDLNGPVLSNLTPVTDPTDSPVFVLNDVTFMFDVADPALVSTDPGSGLDITGCSSAIGGTACTNLTASEGTQTWEVDGPPTGIGVSVDIADAGGNGSGGAMADGPHTVTLSSQDLATSPNVTMDDYTIILDTTAPVIGALNPAPVGSAGTDATSIIMSIGETINDANIITVANLTVTVNGTNAVGGTPSASCAAAATATNLYTLSVTGGEVDRNVIDLSNGTNAVDFSGAAAEAFQIFDPFPAATGGTVTYCFVLDAQDEALTKLAAANPNISQLVTQVAVVWNP